MSTWPTPSPPQGVKEFIAFTMRDIAFYPSRWKAYAKIARPLWRSLMWNRRVNLLRSYISIGLPWDMMQAPSYEARSNSILKKLIKAHRLYRKSLIPSPVNLSSDDIWFKSAINISHMLFDTLNGQYKIPDLTSRPPALKASNTPIRILYISHAWPEERWNGYAIRTHKIAQAFIKQGIEIEVFCKPRSIEKPGLNKDQETIILDGVTYVRPTLTGASNADLAEYLQHYAAAINEKIASFQPDILHAASNFITGLAANIVAQHNARPMIYEVRGLWEITRLSTHETYEKSAGFRAQVHYETMAAQSANHVLTLNTALKDKLVGRGVVSQKISLFPNCGDIETPTDTPLELNINKSGCDFGYVGSFTDYEGLFLLIDAFEDSCQTQPNIQLIIAGDGPLKAALLRRIEASDHKGKIHYVGSLSPPQARALTKWLDVAVIARLSNPVTRLVPPLKPLTAFSVGTPCILSDLPALLDYTAEAKTSVVVKAGNQKSLSDAISLLASNPELRDTLGQNAREWVQNHRHWDANIRQLKTLYEDLIAKT